LFVLRLKLREAVFMPANLPENQNHSGFKAYVPEKILSNIQNNDFCHRKKFFIIK
jgi:hypothetical protein